MNDNLLEHVEVIQERPFNYLARIYLAGRSVSDIREVEVSYVYGYVYVQRDRETC